MPIRSALRALSLLAVALPGPVCAQPAPALPALPGLDDSRSRQISVVVTRGLTRTVDLPTAGLQQARLDMLAGFPVVDADLRALADHWDGLAAQHYVRRLLEAEPRGSDSDIAFYGSIAVATGRVWSMADAVEAMRRLDPATEPPERIKVYSDMLYPHAWAGNSLALAAVIDLNGDGRLFGPLSTATRARLLELGDQTGDGRIALQMAMSLLMSPTPENRQQAQDYLSRAKAGNDLAVQAMAAALLDRLTGAAQQDGTGP